MSERAILGENLNRESPMTAPYGDATTSTSTRPRVSDLQDGPTGRYFTLAFLPGQRLPAHRNHSRILITAVAGSGVVRVAGQDDRVLEQGSSVQIDPDVLHALEAGDGPWDVEVHLIASCCTGCG